MNKDMNKQSGITTNLNIFPPIQPFPIMQQVQTPYTMNFFHQLMLQTKSNQMCFPLPLQVPNPFHHIPGFVPTITPFSFIGDKQHNLRLQQLQQAFQLGIERAQSSSLHEPSVSRKDTIDVGCEVKSQAPKDIHVLKHVSDNSKALISHWDPWFHRRARKQIKIEKNTLNKSSKKSSLVKIRKTRKGKTINSNKCVRISSKTKDTQHGHSSILPTQSIIESYKELMKPNIGVLVGSNESVPVTPHQKDLEVRNL